MPVTNYNSNAPTFTEGTDAWADEVQVQDTSALDQVYSTGQVDRSLKSFMLQAYGGIGKAASATQSINTILQFTSMDAAYGPTAYNCTVAADFDDITADLAGIYEMHFECNAHVGAAGTCQFDIRDDGAVLASANIEQGATAAENSIFRFVSITGIFSVGAASVLDIAVTGSGALTLTTKNARFWIRRIGPSA